MKKIFSIIICIAFFPLVSLTAQNPVDYLNLDTDPRAAALGGGAVAADADAFSVYRNVSAAALTANTAGFSYSWMNRGSDNMHTAAGYYRIGRSGALSAGFRFYLMAPQDYTDGGTYSPRQYDATLGYSHSLTKTLAVGVSARYIESRLSNLQDARTGRAVAGNLSATYRKDSYSLALGVNNVGTGIRHAASKDNLPARVNLGGTYTFPSKGKHAFTGMLQGGYQIMPESNSGFYASAGIEYIYSGWLALRGGYHKSFNAATGPSFWSAGAGVRIGKIAVDAAYVGARRDSPLYNSVYISAGLIL